MDQILSGKYAYLDFSLVKADLADVEAALIQSLPNYDDMEFSAKPFRPSFFMRLIMRLMGIKQGESGATYGSGMSAEQRAEADEMIKATTEPLEPGEGPLPYTIHRDAAADPDRPIVKLAPPGSGPNDGVGAWQTGNDDVRISTLTTAPGWVLIEHIEWSSGGSMLCSGLSGQMPDQDVLYFRYSGQNAEEKHYDFHVNRDYGTPVRRLCHETWPMSGGFGSSFRNPDDAEWEGILDGEVCAYEPEGLYDGVTDETALDNSKLDAILDHNGWSIQKLFGPDARRNPVLFSRRIGGEELNAIKS